MRTQVKKINRAKRRIKFEQFFRQLAVFAVTLFFLVGLVVVDEAYSEMLGRPGVLSIQIRRLDENRLRLDYLGQSFTVSLPMRTDEEKDEEKDEEEQDDTKPPLEGKTL